MGEGGEIPQGSIKNVPLKSLLTPSFMDLNSYHHFLKVFCLLSQEHNTRGSSETG